MVQNCHTVEQEMYWDNQTEGKLLFYMMPALCLCCPSTSLALQHSRQTDSRLRKQLTFRDATTGMASLRKNAYHYPDLMHLTGSSKFLTLPDQSNLSDVTSSVWSFCTPYTRVGSITSRCSQNEPTLLPWTDSGTHGFATVNYHQSNSYLLKSSRHQIFIFVQHISNEGCKFVVWCGARSRLRAF